MLAAYETVLSPGHEIVKAKYYGQNFLATITTCNATLLQLLDKLQENIARITWPLRRNKKVLAKMDSLIVTGLPLL